VREEFDTALLLVTHNEVARRRCDELLTLQSGRLHPTVAV
jgi:predicted ABC-type transport system involved in lysophospholipase L1 biosynthesis ATPase subunit